MTRIDKNKCKGCQLCVDVCNGHIVKSSKMNKYNLNEVKINREVKCNNCLNCYLVCPDRAINLNEE